MATLGIYAPQKLTGWVKDTVDKDWGIYLAVLVRLLLGAALIIAAPDSRFPLAFLVLGWIAIVAAVVVAIMGRKRLRLFVGWWLKQFSPAAVRVWLLFGFAFGGFLIYGLY
ncbi:MAG: hypothetical protein OER97_05515 [Gammaproteobacteria bacterium]|nr:hypothetical protein [Gammaproteobacteria bacterium]